MCIASARAFAKSAAGSDEGGNQTIDELLPQNSRADWWGPRKVDLIVELGKSWASAPDY